MCACCTYAHIQHVHVQVHVHVVYVHVMHMSMHMCMHMSMHMYVYVYVCMHMHMCMHTTPHAHHMRTALPQHTPPTRYTLPMRTTHLVDHHLHELELGLLLLLLRYLGMPDSVLTRREARPLRLALLFTLLRLTLLGLLSQRRVGALARLPSVLEQGEQRLAKQQRRHLLRVRVRVRVRARVS